MSGQAPVREYRLGSIGGMQLSATPAALGGSLGLWATLTAVGVGPLGLPVARAIAAGLAAVALHWASAIVHQLGHAWAARRAGHPMVGARLGFAGLLGTSRYPPDEPPLPPAIHLQRALGGPLASLLLSLAAGALVLALSPVRRRARTGWWLALFLLLENVLVYTAQALLPLGFNDGTVVWRAWAGRR